MNKEALLQFSRNEPNADYGVNFLGVAVQPNIKWNDHIDVVSKRTAEGIFMIRKLM